MADLSFMNQTTSIAALDADYEARRVERARLGLSEIGDPCRRVLWYKHHNYPKRPVEGRVLRLFQLGNLVEEQMATDLMSAGFLIHSRQRQVTFTCGDLKLHGSIDGIIEGLLESDQPHLWECKSMGAKGFAKLKSGGYEAYDEKYKTQCHVYAYGLKLNRIYPTVYCKDTSELYAERIKADKTYAEDQLARAFDAIGGDIPERLSNRRDFYICKWCAFFGPCHDGVERPATSIRW